MKIKVMKFGGTSVATEENRAHVYEKIGRAVEAGYRVVVVVSAMGRRGAPYATDTLMDLLIEKNAATPQRELDMIGSISDCIGALVVATSLMRLGYKTRFLTGGQAGIRTNGIFGDARVTEVKTEKLLSLIEAGVIPVIPGGQGSTEDGEVTVLGRGGSDTTACTLGVALHADATEIYTDVEGIMSADPRVIPQAKLMEKISYQNCVDMASLGAKVMHPRSVETAAKVPEMALYVRSTKSDYPGTLICKETGATGVIGIAVQEDNGIYRGEISKECAARLKEQEVTPVKLDGTEPLFAVVAGERRRFLDVAPGFESVCHCDRVSLIGDARSRMSTLPDLEILYRLETPRYTCLWVPAGSGKAAAATLHRALLER